jgi:uncharacterized protein YrzB (UPF0473 family)
MMKHITLGIALLLVFFTMSAQDITLSFENPEVTTDGMDSFYEVDVMISSDVAFSMGSGQFFLDYNAVAFGAQVNNNGAIAYERPENSLLGGEVIVDVGGTPVPLGAHYTSFISNDTTDSKVSFIWQQNASGGMYGDNIPAGTPVELVHLKIRFLSGATAEDPSVCFDATNPFDDQFFTACGPYDPLVGFTFETADCFNEPGSQILDFTSDCNEPILFEISCQDITVQLDENGTASITAAAVFDGDANDPTIDTLTVDIESFDCSNIGENTVTLTITNTDGSSASCEATITVEDTGAPEAVCQNITLQLDTDGNATITAAQIDNGSTDNCGIASLSISQDTFTAVDAGDNTVTLTVTDDSGNMASCDATVTVVDQVFPEAICQNITVQLDENGVATITAAQVDGGSTGADAMTIDIDSFDCSNIGENTVTLTVTSVDDNSDLCTAIVTVEDTMEPEALCQNITVQLDENGNASITATDIDGGSTDNCGVASLSIDTTSFNCSNLGENTVILTVTDTSGNMSSCEATVIVEDTTAPEVICQAVTVQLDESGNTVITADAIDGGSTDNCGIASLAIDVTSFDCSNIGENTVTLTIIDINGNEASCTATVTVEDTIAPEVVCQDITVQLDESGNASITATAIDGGSTDNCAIETLSIDIDTFTCVDLGDNMVTLTVTDIHGNETSCTAIVTVEDIIAPTAVCQDITLQLDANGIASFDSTDLGGGSTDNCDLTVDVVATMYSGEISDIDIQDTYIVGDNPSFVDAYSFVAPFTGTYQFAHTTTGDTGAVAILYDAPPVRNSGNLISRPEFVGFTFRSPEGVFINGTLDYELEQGTTYFVDISTSQSGQVIPSYDGFVRLVNEIDATCGNIGTTTLELMITDVSGNTDTCTATITVEDVQPPTVLCPDNQTIELTEAMPAFELPDYVATGEAIVSDNCEPVALTQDPVPGTMLEEGVYMITLCATDASGNESCCTFELTVEDVLGINDDVFLTNLDMYPNPARDQVFISNPNGITITNIALYDLAGRLVLNNKQSQTLTEISVDLSTIAKGTYFVRIESVFGIVHKQLIKR